MKLNRIKLMKQLLKFGNMVTDKGELFYEGDLAEGLEVFVEGEDGEMKEANDGDYIVDGTIYVIKDGKIDSIKPVEPEAETEPEMKDEPVEAAEIAPEPEVAPDYEAVIKEKDDKIAELEAKVAELEAMVKEKDAKEVEMSAEILKLSNETVGKPAHVEVKETKLTGNKFIDNYLAKH